MKDTISTRLWNYLPDPQRDLITQGFQIFDLVVRDKLFSTHDYSFLVFPFAKAYEGFLKKVFVDADFITEREYNSDHFRVGKALSPGLARRLRDHSVYTKMCNKSGCGLSDRAWDTWKQARNIIFHYYPHNLNSISLEAAEEKSGMIIDTMEIIIEKMNLRNK